MIKFFVCLLATISLFSETRIIHSLNEISMEEFTPKTLVMCDQDDVLIYPQDALMQNWRSNWKPQGIRIWTAEEDTIAWMNVKFQLMDPAGPQFIKTLNERGIPTIGFSSFAMDQPGIVESIPVWRDQHLRELGIHFKVEKEIVFPGQIGYIPPSFEKGILYCSDFYKKDKDNKGRTLSIFLDWLDWTPELIVLIDDGEKHIDSVQKELDRRKIPFIGYLYIPKDLDPIDEEVAELQYKTIIDHKIWLSDQEVKKSFFPSDFGSSYSSRFSWG